MAVEYTTIQGDTWDAISFKVYGSAAYMSRLMEANTAHVQTVIFGAGVVLTVPDVPASTSADLPPWRRNG